MNLETQNIPHDTNELLEKHRSILCSLRKSNKNEELGLSLLNLILKLHKCPYKQRYIAWSSTCSTKPLFKSTSVASAIKVILKLPILKVA